MISAKKCGALFSVVVLVVVVCTSKGVAGPSQDLGWVYLQSGSQDLQSKPGRRKAPSVRLGQGTLAAVLKLQSKDGNEWARVRVLDLATLGPQEGWIEVRGGALLPAGQFPSDSDLFRLLGGEYLSDVTASHTEIARFLLPQPKAPPLLLCYVVSPTLGLARLAVFSVAQGNLLPGPSVEFSLGDVSSGIVSLEVRDLVGDGNECMVTHEVFHAGPATGGMNLLIRRVVEGEIRILWKAPIEYRNLGSYPPHPNILTPPEKNIGVAGSVTTGQVRFVRRGNVSEPVWKGKVDFYQIGHEEPLESVAIEKTCPWNGTVFAPLEQSFH